jgi:hypothetical protein
MKHSHRKPLLVDSNTDLIIIRKPEAINNHSVSLGRKPSGPIIIHLLNKINRIVIYKNLVILIAILLFILF